MRPACNVSPPDVVMSRVVDVRGEGLLYDEGDWQTLAIVRAPTPLSPLRSSCGAVLGSTPPECVDGLWSTAAQSGSTLINSVILTMSASELVPYDFRHTSTMKGRDKKDTETPKRGASKKDALIGIVYEITTAHLL
ncbi:hypothetical protein THAOC_15158 [Thalassiosira oceanica]|uniref:Uncharacterized protein n=1 Tax=Thalassiosira oceanica TaxID=159749 RepID=K0SFL5_THAOC|nr:hypothetical protein THAOC_15158 [Thalassiosira oceanica]|eukprot:EJK64135.1 hypothetical protein THAOC_15158 [Thalassiosira oceanica]